MLFDTTYEPSTTRPVGSPVASGSAQSAQYLQHRYFWSCSLSQRATGDQISGLAVIQLMFGLSAHILDGSEVCIMLTGTVCIKSSHICKLAYFYNANVKIAASLNPIVKCSVRLSDLIVLNTEGIKITALRRPPKVHKRIFSLQVKLKSELSLVTMDLHLFLSREEDRGSRKVTYFSCLVSQRPFWSRNQGPIGGIQSCIQIKQFVSNRFDPTSTQHLDIVQMRKWNQTSRPGGRRPVKTPHCSRSCLDWINSRLKNEIFMLPDTIDSSTSKKRLKAVNQAHIISILRFLHHVVSASIRTFPSSMKATTIILKTGTRYNIIRRYR